MAVHLSKSSALAMSALLVAGFGCKERPTSMEQVDPPGFSRAELLASVANNVIMTSYRDFETAATGMEAALKDYQAAIDSTGDKAAKLELARAAWKNTMVAWQRAEVVQLGPLGKKGKTLNGASIRDEVFSWPTTNTCRVEQELVDQKYSQADFFTASLVNSYGMDALEYLLFVHSMTNTCPSLVNINRDGTWALLTETDLEDRRAAYAYAIAKQITVEAKRLIKAWDASGGNFLKQLTKAGTSDSDYESTQTAINELFAAMYYIELSVKDDKLALPAALSIGCMEMSCPEKLESRWAKHSRENILANLQAFRSVFVGGDQTNADHIGFDDWLTALGSEDLSRAMLKALDDTVALLQAQNISYVDALAMQQTALVDAHDALKTMTDLLKTQFVSILALEVPQEGAADND